MRQKRGQIAIFVIVALLIVVVLLLIFFQRQIFDVVGGGGDPISQIKSCAEDFTSDAVKILSPQGGSLDPEHFILYDDNKVEYICFTEENYRPCVMQKPFIKQDIEKEIEFYVKPKLSGCIAGVKSDLEKKGYDVRVGDVSVDINLVPNNILIEIKSDLTITKGGTEEYKSIKTEISSSLYDLALISSSIINWEARYGDSETMNYMMYYPHLKVEKKKQGDGTTVYILTDRNTEEVFLFASRSVVIPAGIIG